MTQFRRFGLLVWLTLAIVQTSNISAQSILGAGTKVAVAAIAGETVESVIESARREATRLLAEADNSGNVLVTRAADELNLLAENVARMLSNETNQVFEELEEDKRDLLLGLASATNAAQSLSDQAYTLKDTLSLDLRSILGSVPFVKEQLVLQRISGLSILEGMQTYTIEILGSYVGLPGNDHNSKVSVYIDGKEIEGVEIDPREIHFTEITIPASALESYFNPSRYTRVPITLRIEQTFRNRALGFLWNVEKSKEYDSDLNLTLYPSYAGTIDFTSRHRVYDWKKIDNAERSMTHADHCSDDCGDHYGTSHSVTIRESGNSIDPQGGERRITGATCPQTAGVGGYSVPEGTRISDDMSTATCQVRFRTQSQTFTLVAEREEFGVVGEQEEISQVRVFFDRISEVRIPKSTTSIFLRGRLITGDLVDMLASEITVSSPVEVVRRIENLEDTSLFVRARRPEGL